MMFKTEIFDIARDIAQSTEGWTFSSTGDFVNKSLKHTDLVVSPGFTFGSEPSCLVNPVAGIRNWKIVKLYREIFGVSLHWTLYIKFQLESDKYRGASSVKRIYPKIKPFTSPHGVENFWSESFLTKDKAGDYLRGVLLDGKRFIDGYFDLTNEDSLLKHLPMVYKWMDNGIGNTGKDGSFLEGGDGVVHCIAAMIVGNFDFVERYMSDDVETMTPKRVNDLQKIAAVLPDFKRRYNKMG